MKSTVKIAIAVVSLSAITTYSAYHLRSAGATVAVEPSSAAPPPAPGPGPQAVAEAAPPPAPQPVTQTAPPTAAPPEASAMTSAPATPQLPAEPLPSRSSRPEAESAPLMPSSYATLGSLGGARPTLQLGSTGKAVQALQSGLRLKHGYPVPVDGVFDERTERAVRQFQEHMGLSVTGVTNTATWNALINHFVELEQSGPGFYRYYTDMIDSSWGTPKTIDLIHTIGTRWTEQGHDARIGVNDISLPHGDYFPPHSSHQKGVDVDVRPMRNDGLEAGGFTWQSTVYSRRLTQQLVDTIRSTGEVVLIFFNDPQIKGVQPWEGHDDHLHIRFRP